MAALFRLSAVIASFAAPALAQDGFLDDIAARYLPWPAEESTLSCEAPAGQAGAAYAIRGDQVIGPGTTCTLSDPVEVRDMNAVLFEADCVGDGPLAPGGRLMVMVMRDGVAVIRDQAVLELTRCPA